MEAIIELILSFCKHNFVMWHNFVVILQVQITPRRADPSVDGQATTSAVEPTTPPSALPSFL